MRKINRTYKFRLYSNKVQVDLLARHFGCARFVYNYFLDQRREQYRLTSKSDNYYAQAKALTALKKQEATAWLRDVNSQTLQFAIRSLEVAYTNFFQKRAKFPNFKFKHSKNSFTIPQFASIAGGRLFIPKFKEGIKCHIHREIKGKIGKVTISRHRAESISFPYLLRRNTQLRLEKLISRLVLTWGENWKYTSNLTINGDWNSHYIENYIELRKMNKSEKYDNDIYAKYTIADNKLYFRNPYGRVHILYRGIECDDDGLSRLTEKEVEALAAYLAWITKQKVAWRINDINSLRMSELAKAEWMRLCSEARVSKHLTQNDMDRILDTKTLFNRKHFNWSLKPYK